MNQNWFSDITWYGNLLELLGAIVGILQYLGAERIRKAANSFDLRNDNNFERVGSFRIPIEKNLASWLRDRKPLLNPLWKNRKISSSFYLIAFLTGLVAMLLDLGIKTDALRIIGQLVTAFVIISLAFVILPALKNNSKESALKRKKAAQN
ncbi:MAG: hypothetical protein H6642_18620 [Caldilineaceae bacterium]|nr:hypothetical protein [Caldilineaceae bacterium]